MKHKFYFIYWLPNQSKLFSDPYYYGTDDRDDYIEKISIAKQSGYDIEYMTAL